MLIGPSNKMVKALMLYIKIEKKGFTLSEKSG